MDQARADGLSWGVALRLGRVSNLPTVWTNVAAGVALSGAGFPIGAFAGLTLALSLFYIGGMYLNDAFDRDIDARERPERPIPSGVVPASAVFAIGFGLIATGWLMLVAIGYAPADGTGWRAPLAGALLAGAIVVYDMWHKANPLSPVIMGLCRLLVYVTAAVAVVPFVSGEVALAAAVALGYLIGLTYAAKQEALGRITNAWPLALLAVAVVYAGWTATTSLAGFLAAAAFVAWLAYSMVFLLKPDRVNVPRAVVSLIAGLCLLDAVFIAGAGYGWLALAAAAAFLLTLALQRHVPGT
jgi:4-hydroxybenzoate polyprenyltransferase